jgi:CheY-like chemotaxis protein
MSEHDTEHRDTILVVDDNKNNLDLMLVTLSEQNYRLLAATSGERALKVASKVTPDLVLMDIQMPGMDGYETTRELKKRPALKHVPVLFLSALNDPENVVKCFNAGGVDYISKPFKKEELLARVQTHLSIKHLQAQITAERDKISLILNNMLPPTIVDKLKDGQTPEPEFIDDAAVLFTDFSGFARLTKKLGPGRSIENLNRIFFGFDSIAQHFGLERVKTIGDAFMAVSGVINATESPLLDSIMAGLKMQEFIALYDAREDFDWQVRIGIHSGPLMAGIVGIQKIAFDVWGDTVNMASRLENLALLHGVTIAEADSHKLNGEFISQSRGVQELHNLGQSEIYQIDELSPTLPAEKRKHYDQLNVEELLERDPSQDNLIDEIVRTGSDK